MEEETIKDLVATSLFHYGSSFLLLGCNLLAVFYHAEFESKHTFVIYQELMESFAGRYHR